MSAPSFTCPKCGATSHNLNDVAAGYCGRCHDWTGKPPEPLFAHDCRRCVFLGSYLAHDLYFCGEQLGGPTVIARYGAGRAYTSGLALAGVDPILGEARERAAARGLLA